MKRIVKKNSYYARAAMIVALLAAWVSVPFVMNSVKADGTPVILVRDAVLTSPSGSPNPWGAAQWQLYQSGNREIEVEAEDLSFAQGTVLNAFVDGSAIGNMVVDDRQKAKLKLKTEDGQIVPVVNNGSTVEVRNGAAIVVNGVFGGGGATPTPTGTPTGTPSPSPSPSGTPNGTPSPSPSVTPTGTPTGTPSPSPSPSGTPNGTPSPSPSPGNSGDLFAGLSGPTLNGVVPTGFGEYEIHSSRVELEVRVRQINLPGGTSLGVVVDGTLAGNMTLESDGEGRLRLRSDNGQTVPNVVAGSTIEVRNGGSAILTGTFMGFSATPSPSPSPSPSGTPGGTPSPTPSPSPSFGRFFESHLNGSGMTPPVTTAANGELKVQLSLDETQATMFGEFHNLSSNQTGGRIETGIGTPITIRDLAVVGGLNGNFATATFAVTPVQVQMLRAGLWTAVITSVNNPNGEIRGSFRQQSSFSDFNGDGEHDLAVFRPATGSWYVQNPSGFTAIEFGGANDRIVSGDYDGDGKTDAAMYRDVAGQGVWEIKRSSDGGLTTTQFGLASDTPVRGDFDGDGRLDLAVFRSSTGMWYIRKSNGTGHIVTQFGNSSDKPMVSDMDGDGRDDIAVFRGSEGNWYWLRSSDGQFAGRQWGTSGDVPVAGDFDGDGKTDITVFRPSNGIWYTYLSTTGGYRATYFGLGTDVPVAGNYDGDGVTDIAVFRPSDGNWYILRSADNSFQMFQFGLNGDIPLIVR